MQKWFIPLVAMILLLAACGQNKEEQSAQSDVKTLALKTAEGKQNVKIPQTPKRIVVLAPTYAGGLKIFRCQYSRCI